MGLDIYLKKQGEDFAPFDSQTDPEHYWKVGYFRSSYNHAGFNGIMRNLGLPTLYGVCLGSEESTEDYNVTPDWAGMKDRAESTRQLVDLHPRASWRVLHELFYTTPVTDDVKSAPDAFNLADRQLSVPQAFGAYSGYGGLYSCEPMPIVAVVAGHIHGDVYVVLDCPTQKKWLMDAISIVAETADYVLSQPPRGTSPVFAGLERLSMTQPCPDNRFRLAIAWLLVVCSAGEPARGYGEQPNPRPDAQTLGDPFSFSSPASCDEGAGAFSRGEIEELLR